MEAEAVGHPEAADSGSHGAISAHHAAADGALLRSGAAAGGRPRAESAPIRGVRLRGAHAVAAASATAAATAAAAPVAAAAAAAGGDAAAAAHGRHAQHLLQQRARGGQHICRICERAVPAAAFEAHSRACAAAAARASGTLQIHTRALSGVADAGAGAEGDGSGSGSGGVSNSSSSSSSVRVARVRPLSAPLRRRRVLPPLGFMHRSRADGSPPPPPPPWPPPAAPAMDTAPAATPARPNAAAAAAMPPVGDAESDVALSDFEVLQPLRSGAFGSVFLVRKRLTGDVYALKMMDVRFLVQENMLANVIVERDILAATSHPHIVPLFFSFASPTKLFFAMEYMLGGDLCGLMGERGPFPERMARHYAAEVALGLGYLHGIGVLHRDLKPENVLISAQGHVKLIDFGLAELGKVHEAAGAAVPHLLNPKVRRISGVEFGGAGADEEDLITGTPMYMSPEIILREPVGPEADWWALGVLLFEMIFGWLPFGTDAQPVRLAWRITHGDVGWPEDDEEQEEEQEEEEQEEAGRVSKKEAQAASASPACCRGPASPQCRALIAGALTAAREERIATGEAFRSHAFFADLEWGGDSISSADMSEFFVPAKLRLDDTSHFVGGGDVWKPDIGEIESETAPGGAWRRLSRWRRRGGSDRLAGGDAHAQRELAGRVLFRNAATLEGLNEEAVSTERALQDVIGDSLPDFTREHAREIFDAIDTDGSSDIDPEEFQAMAFELGETLTLGEARAEIDAILRESGAEKVTFGVFYRWWTAQERHQQKDARGARPGMAVLKMKLALKAVARGRRKKKAVASPERAFGDRARAVTTLGWYPDIFAAKSDLRLLREETSEKALSVLGFSHLRERVNGNPAQQPALESVEGGGDGGGLQDAARGGDAPVASERVADSSADSECVPPPPPPPQAHADVDTDADTDAGSEADTAEADIAEADTAEGGALEARHGGGTPRRGRASSSSDGTAAGSRRKWRTTLLVAALSVLLRPFVAAARCCVPRSCARARVSPHEGPAAAQRE